MGLPDWPGRGGSVCVGLAGSLSRLGGPLSEQLVQKFQHKGRAGPLRVKLLERDDPGKEAPQLNLGSLYVGTALARDLRRTHDGRMRPRDPRNPRHRRDAFKMPLPAA